MKKIFLFLFFLINVNIYSQIVNGQFIIRGNNIDEGGNTIQLSDGNYLYSGLTSSYGNGGKDILLIKFQQDFSILWQKTLGGSDDEYLYDRQTC